MLADPRYHEPFHWWGPGGHVPPVPTMRDLLRDGAIDVSQAAFLWTALARRASLVVLAGPSGAGKTALLTALLEFLPPGTRRLYLRGCFESFAFSRDAAIAPSESVLLVNEISPHLPVYLWGTAVGRVLDEAASGFMVVATAHAESVPGFVGALAGSPLRIPAPKIAAFDFAVVLRPKGQDQSGQAVKEIWRLRATREGVALTSWQDVMPDEATQSLSPAEPPFPIPWFSPAELTERAHLLEALRTGRIERLPVFRVLAP